MKKTLNLIFGMLILLLLTNETMACTKPMTINPTGPLSYNGPADSVHPGQAIGSWGGDTSTYDTYCGPDLIYSAYVEPIDQKTNITYSDGSTTYPVFPTGVPGIGYIIGMKDPNAGTFIAIDNPSTKTFPSPGTPNQSSVIGFNAKVTYVATESLKTGVYIVPSRVIANLTFRDYYNGIRESTTLTLNSVTINVTATSCKVNQPSLQVPLGTFNVTDFTSVGSNVGSHPFSVDLQCDENIKVNMTLNATQNAETSDNTVIALDNAGAENVAKGVGVQLLYNNTPLAISSKILTNTVVSAGPVSIPLVARYYQTSSQVTAGTANATASLFLTYE